MLEGAIDEALLAVDLYNQPRQPRRLEGFLVHMHIACWLHTGRGPDMDHPYRRPTSSRFHARRQPL